MDAITTAFNGMVTFMLAKFVLNDLPHAVGLFGKLGSSSPSQVPERLVTLSPLSPERPNTLEITYKNEPITVGAVETKVIDDRLQVSKLTIDRPGLVSREFLESLTDALDDAARTKGLRYLDVEPEHWQSVMYRRAGFTEVEVGEGVAPVMRRPVLAEKQKKLGSGNPGNPDSFRVERTTVDKVVDDLERTWHRIDSDMDPRMQSSLGILKEVMGHYYEEPCVVVWDNSDLVGVAVYETYDAVDLGTRETYMKELASFTHKSGVGRLLVEEVVKIARESGSQNVTLSYGAGAKSFYERLGFVEDRRLMPAGEVGTLMMKRLKSG